MVGVAPAPTSLRARLYRLIGPRLDYILHLRPAEWPIMAAHTTLGYLLATGLGDAAGDRLGQGAAGIAVWVVCLNGGTLAVNSAFDRDEGDIAYLRAPPPPPRHLFAFGLALMAFGQALALLLPAAFGLAYAACFALSLVYSVPPVRLKAVAGADWLINMIGFGVLTPFAGWATTGRPIAGTELIVLAAFGPLFAALYPLTQLYQAEEDRRRGDRTLALRLGAVRSLDVALCGAAIAFALLAWAGAHAGWRAADWRWAVVVTAAAAWAGVLVPWRRTASERTAREHELGMYRALVAWAVTDIAVLVAWGL